jgi:geranylgeranyl pyrophosphate synthase
MMKNVSMAKRRLTMNCAVFLEELKSLYVGQSLDLHWTSNLICPSVEQYLQMVENSTFPVPLILRGLPGRIDY